MLFTVCFIRYRALQNALGSALRDQQATAAIFSNDGEQPPFEIKRDFTDLRVLADIGMVVAKNGEVERVSRLRLLQRLVDGIWNTRLKSAVDVDVSKALLRRITKRIDVLVQAQLTGRQRSCFVAAEHVDTSEVLHR